MGRVIDFARERAKRVGGGVFNPSPYLGTSAADDLYYPEEVERIRSLYPELARWSDLSLENAWSGYVGITFGWGWPDETRERVGEFLAYLVLNQVGLRISPDGLAEALRMVAAMRPWARAP